MADDISVDSMFSVGVVAGGYIIKRFVPGDGVDEYGDQRGDIRVHVTASMETCVTLLRKTLNDMMASAESGLHDFDAIEASMALPNEDFD